MPHDRWRLWFLPLLLLTLTTLSGCAGKSVSKSNLIIDPTDAYRLGYRLTWTTSLDLRKSERFTHAVVLNELLVTVQEPSSLVSAVELRDGGIRWRRVVGVHTDTIFEPFRPEDDILLNSETELFHMDSQTGRVLSRADLATAVADRPAVFDGVAVFGGLNGRVFGHSLQSNFPRWNYQMPGGIVTRPVADGHQVLVCDTHGIYAMIAAGDGTLLFKGRTFGRISAAPALTSLGAFIASEDQTLYSLNPANGRDNWKLPAEQPLKRSPLVFSNTLFLSLPGRGLRCMDARSGQELWRSDLDLTPVVLTDARLLAYNRDALYLLDPPTGKLMLQIPVRDIQRVVTTEKGALLVLTMRGVILRLDPA